MQRQPSGSVRLVGDEAVSLGIPLAGSDGIVRAALVLGWSRDPAFMHALMWRNLQVLALVTAAVALALALALVLRRGERRRRERGGARARFVLPLVALLLAQGVYAGYTIGMFRDVWLDVVRHNAVVLATGLQRGLDRVLGYGLELHQLRGVDRLFSRTIHAYPLIGSIALVASDGRVLQEVDARGSVTGDAQRRFADDPGYTVSLPLGGPDASRGALALRLDGGAVAAALRDRALDAATVAVVALVVAVELLLLLAVVMNRALPSGQGRQPSADGTDVGGLTRPVMFGYLFACAMPASFLPLFARSLPAANLPLPPGLLIALPISLEMGCGLLAALMAGRLSERKGWRHAVLQGLLLSCVRFVASALAPNLAWFVSARGVVGLGYGLTWMGLQALVVSRSPPTHRGRSMAGCGRGPVRRAALGRRRGRNADGAARFPRRLRDRGGLAPAALGRRCLAVAGLRAPFRNGRLDLRPAGQARALGAPVARARLRHVAVDERDSFFDSPGGRDVVRLAPVPGS
ncbi:putative membrane protein [Bordetella pertussis STO1-CHOC-0017]|nr:putative membrane protein [Bordetella pertussis STO1-CHOC-0017]